MRVFERGCGETMACGTGACASVVSGIINKKHGDKVTVHLLGGDLLIEWDGSFGHSVYMTGPAQRVFEGEIPS
jgi:diaminopimelate epimerase